MTAPNDIWKPAWLILSGRSIKVATAAMATLRIVIAGRSSMIALSEINAMMKARSVATDPPAKR